MPRRLAPFSRAWPVERVPAGAKAPGRHARDAPVGRVSPPLPNAGVPVRRRPPDGSLRQELERRIRQGQCVYCRAPAEPDRPLTREHVIPRAKGGHRRDPRILVPACARCNRRRGCQEIVLFLLAHPRRIAAFLEYLATLPPDLAAQLDVRVFAELYAAVWLLDDLAAQSGSWRQRLHALASGRRLHRRRYAARRLLLALDARLAQGSDQRGEAVSPSCLLLPAADHPLARLHQLLLGQLLGVLALTWQVPAERVRVELTRELQRTCTPALAPRHDSADAAAVDLDGGRRRRRRQRVPRMDARRRGAGARRGRVA